MLGQRLFVNPGARLELVGKDPLAQAFSHFLIERHGRDARGGHKTRVSWWSDNGRVGAVGNTASFAYNDIERI